MASKQTYKQTQWDPYAGLDNIKVPSWVTESVKPVGSVGLFDDMYAAQNRHRQEKLADIQDILNAEKLDDMLRSSKMKAGLSDYVKQNPQAKDVDIYGQLRTQAASAGDVETLLKSMEAERSLAKQAEIERKNQQAEEFRQYTTLATLANVNPEAAKFAANKWGMNMPDQAMVPVARPRAGGAKQSIKVWTHQDSGEQINVDMNDPEQVRAAIEGGFLAKQAKDKSSILEDFFGDNRTAKLSPAKIISNDTSSSNPRVPNTRIHKKTGQVDILINGQWIPQKSNNKDGVAIKG